MIYAKHMPAYEEIKARAEAVLKFDSTEYVGGVNCPTLVVGARDDAMTPFYFSEELSNAIPYARLCALETGGHYFPRTRIEQMVIPIFRFLRTSS